MQIWGIEVLVLAFFGFIIDTEQSRSRHKRQFVANEGYQKNHQIPYYIDPKVRGVQKIINAFGAAKDHLETSTCIRLVEKSQWTGYEHTITRTDNDNDACSASLGQARWYSNFNFTIKIGPTCWEREMSVLHELFHTLNMNHPHSYTDSKDNFVNVPDGYYPVKRVVPFDPSTILAYGYAVTDKRYNFVTGQRERVPFYDYLAINTYYNCTQICDSYPRDFCTNGGYRHPNNCNICMCPYGFIGLHCEQLVRSCGGILNATIASQTVDLMNKTTAAAGIECFWFIQAPAGKKIDWKFEDNPTNRWYPYNKIYIYGNEDIRQSAFLLYHNIDYKANNIPENTYKDVYPGNLLRIATRYDISWGSSDVPAKLTFRYV